MMYDMYQCPRCKHYEWDNDAKRDTCTIHGALPNDDRILRGDDCPDVDKKKGKKRGKRR